RSVHGRCARLLGELLACGVHGHRHVEPARLRKAEQPLQVTMCGRRAQQVGAAHDVRDALSRVVDDYGEVVGGQAVASNDDEVARVGRKVVYDRPLYTVDEPLLPGLDADADGGVAVQLTAVATRAGVAQAAVRRRRTNGRARAAAAERRGTLEQAVGNGTVDVGARALAQHLAVPFGLEGLERSQNVVGRARHLARRVDVLDADEPLAAGLAGVNEARRRGAERAEVERAGRGGREAAYIAHDRAYAAGGR